MKKLFAFFAIAWQNTIAYRSERVVWTIIEVFPLVYMLSLWKHQEIIGKMTAQEASYLIFYYVLALLIARLTASHYEDWVIEMIKNGEISQHLLKPFRFQTFIMGNEMAWRASGMLFSIAIVVALFPVLRAAYQTLSLSLLHIAAFLLMLIIAFLQRFFFSWLISLLAFWLDEAHAFIHFKWMLEGIFGGQWLPVAFFPLWFQQISRWTPLYSWYTLPIQTITGKLSIMQIVTGIGVSTVWVGMLFAVGQFLWHRALKKYSAVGA